MHSSRTRTAHSSSRSRGSPPGTPPPDQTPWTRHPFPRDQVPPLGSGAPPQDQAPTQDQTPGARPPLPVDRQTPVYILSCPKLHLRAVTRMHSSRMRTVGSSSRLVVAMLWGGICLPGGCLPWGCTPPPPVDRILDTRL